jgi:hypothetical protein
LLALCQALQLTPAETEYAFNLTGLVPPVPNLQDTNQQLDDFLTAMLPKPAYVMSQQLTIEAANSAYTKMFEWRKTQSPLERNLIWRIFNDPYYQTSLVNWTQYAQFMTAVFRNLYSQTSDSKFLYQVFQSVNQNPTFLSVWNSLKVATFEPQRLFVQTHDHQELYLVENTFEIPATHQFIVVENAGDMTTHNHLAHIETK